MADVVVAVAAAAGICSLAKVVVQSIRQRLRRKRRGRGKPLREVVAACEARWFLQDMQLAMAGDAEAMVRVGHMLMVGYGAKQDPAAAAQWLREAWAISNFKEPARWAVLDPEESAVPRMNARRRKSGASAAGTAAAAAAAAAAAEGPPLPPAAAPSPGGHGDGSQGAGPTSSSGGGSAAGGGHGAAQQQQAAHRSGTGHDTGTARCSASSSDWSHSDSSSSPPQHTYGQAGDVAEAVLLGRCLEHTAAASAAAAAGCHCSTAEATAGSSGEGCTGARTGAPKQTATIKGPERAPGQKQQQQAGQDHDRDQLLRLAAHKQRQLSLVALEVLQRSGGAVALM